MQTYQVQTDSCGPMVLDALIKIKNEIDAFNDCNKKLAGDCNTNYINITEEGRESKWNKDLIAADGLHPSEIEYARWAHRLENEIRKCVIF